MLQKLFFSSFLLIAFTTLSLPAHAGFGGNTKEAIILEDSSNLFPRHFYTIELFNNPNISVSKFTLRLASYGEVSGCAEMSDATVKIEKAHDTLRLKVIDSEVMIDSEARYTNYDCDIKKNKSYFDIELDRDALIKKKINHIQLVSETYGEFGKMDINVDKYKIEISAKSARATSMVTFWFFPKNAVIIHAPQAKSGDNVQDEILSYGRSQGLVSLEEYLDKFELPYNANNYMFFSDPSHLIARHLMSPNQNMAVGKITPTRIIHDANGTKKIPYSLDLYATLPGQKK